MEAKHFISRLAGTVIERFTTGGGCPNCVADALVAFEQDFDPDGAVKIVDQLVDAHEPLEDLREYLIDLAVMKSMASMEILEEEDEEEWLASLEDDTDDGTDPEEFDRGTEAMNFLIYLTECKEGRHKPTAEDFINEYLLVDDEVQEEFFIYEPLIANSQVVDGPLPQVFEVAASLPQSPVQELFLPMVLFFRNYDRNDDKIFDLIQQKSTNPELNSALLQMFLGFWRGA